ncbi:MAG: mRNA interferase MazF [Actinoplanes sp.]|nr:mRNA interferase MazF [Actinoplanes sp.]
MKRGEVWWARLEDQEPVVLLSGVVRVALPRDGRVFCTWLLALTPDYLIGRIGVLSPEKLRQLDNALRLASIE